MNFSTCNKLLSLSSSTIFFEMKQVFKLVVRAFVSVVEISRIKGIWASEGVVDFGLLGFALK